MKNYFLNNNKFNITLIFKNFAKLNLLLVFCYLSLFFDLKSNKLNKVYVKVKH